MGKQAKIQTKRIINREYLPLFNDDCIIIEEFLTDKGCLISYVADGNYIDYLPTWEINKYKLKQLIDELSTEKSDTKIISKFTAKHLVKMFKSWLKMTNNNENFSDNDFIYIDWY